MSKIRSICVYCGSSTGNNPVYREAGLALGRAIAENDLRLIYGGGTRGIMGAVAEGAATAGGKVTGIIPTFLLNKEADGTKNDWLDEQIITDNMHQRKQLMFERSDAFVTLPGGIGSVEEIVEMMTWAQLGHHRKPMVFANINGFWNPMIAMLDYMRAEGFIHTGHRVQPKVLDQVADIIPYIFDAAVKGDASGDDEIIERM
jgi:uncharacterized protein (TIGR00730 family)